MTRRDISSRRSFLKVGVVLAAPLTAVPAVALASNEPQARLADENAIRVLHQDWLRRVTAGTAKGKEMVLPDGVAPSQEKISAIATLLAGPPDEIEIGADGKTARGHFHCTVEIETPIAKIGTLAQMASLQGGGFVRRTEPRVLVVDCAKAGGVWSIVRLHLATAQA